MTEPSYLVDFFGGGGGVCDALCTVPYVHIYLTRLKRTDTLFSVSIAVEAALRAGYRAIDTAAVYRNHREIAASLRRLLPELGLARSDIFLTSKLSPADQERVKDHNVT